MAKKTDAQRSYRWASVFDGLPAIGYHGCKEHTAATRGAGSHSRQSTAAEAPDFKRRSASQQYSTGTVSTRISTTTIPPKDGIAMGTMISAPRPTEVRTGISARSVVADVIIAGLIRRFPASTVASRISEIVAGFHVEYSGSAFAVFFLAEYANMILISGLTAILFTGGWLSPFEGVPVLGDTFLAEGSIFWFLGKTVFFMFMFLWYRATWPRYRYDQIMRLGWKVLIPITLVWVMLAALMTVLGIVVKGS